jgi:hypothetical protein
MRNCPDCITIRAHQEPCDRFTRADGSTFYLSVPAKDLELRDDVRQLVSRTRPGATA